MYETSEATGLAGAAEFVGSPLRKGAAAAEFARDLVAALSKTPRSIAPKYFYDAAGSALFDRICELPEYYPTRTEWRILTSHAHDIAQCMGSRADIVEFGAGSLAKIRLLLDAFVPRDAPRRYFPVDISAEHLDSAARKLHADYPQLSVQPVAADYMKEEQLAGLAASLEASSQRRVGFFPGSTIGNFDPDEAAAFLRLAARLLRGGGLLVGVDLVKEPQTLHRAYNDAQGVTAAFNLNLLRRANDELGADFDVKKFAHYAFYEPVKQRVEMHLLSLCAQTVRLAGREFAFEEGGSLHTENSYKFTIEGFRALAVSAGFVPGPVWTDEARLFSVHWLESPSAG
ncbi:dimethylhistidine N-methyltransferase [Trinickia symbiotica]|uniref:L-histidine N(alpha)-methyltransferase n=1 Tax=Trinickia symbiotica TaxID=863227 RepID=UPI0003A03AB3|nr:dimethylhistidine N-methyltransferase [Trinickia symbiotica]